MPHVRRSLALGLIPVLLVASAVSLVTPAIAADPEASPGRAAPTVTADGPFGRVEGLAVPPGETPDTAVLPVLDAWAVGTNVRFRPTVGTLAPWRVTAVREPAEDPLGGHELGTGDGDADVTLTLPGLFLVRLDGTLRPDGDAIEASWWWRIAVPDRTLPEGETDPPPPAIELASGDEAIELEQGSGCFLGTCGDIGRISPPDLLPTLTTIEHAPLSMTLDDGSGVVGWSVVISPVGQDGGREIVLGAARDTWTAVAWVPAPTAGDWVVTTSVTFDRDRGSFDGYGRLVVEEDPGS